MNRGRPQRTFNGVDFTSLEEDKIAKLCTTFGLNEEETRQLIVQLRAGRSAEAESTNDNPICNDRKLASIVSAKNEELSFNDSDFKFESEYSFKPITKHGIASQEQSFEKALIGKMKDEEEKFQELRVQNEILAKQKTDLQSKVNVLLQMKAQQSQIIVGLKNAVCTLTSLLKDKEQAYTELQQNYERLSNILHQRLNTQRELQRPQKDYPRRIDHKPSRESILAEVQMNANFERKQSKELSKTKSSQNISQKAAELRPSLKWSDAAAIQNREPKQKTLHKKQNKLDMSKYKVFIDQLKNICANKPHRA